MCASLTSRRYRHDEFEILQSSRLGYLPVNTRRHERLVVLVSIQRHFCHVEYEVANMTEILILAIIPSEVRS